MAKKTPFFSHDMNARHDPKMTAMLSVYGVQGYGMFWILVEMMGEAEGYKLSTKGKYAFDSYAKQSYCERNTIVSFVNDCIHEFELFQEDEEGNFWSPSLLRRMEYRDYKSKKATESVNKRWDKSESDTNVLETNNERNTINKTKQNTKELLPDGNESSNYRPSIDQVRDYCEERENGVDPEKWFDHYSSNGWKVGKNTMKDWRAAVRTWERSTNGKSNVGKFQQASFRPESRNTTASLPLHKPELSEAYERALANRNSI